ncbi:hypothetical protein ACLB2K_055821 [Fragaria x ananassa]
MVALCFEDLDSFVQNSPLQPLLSYVNTLKNPVGRFSQTMVDDFEFSDDDCVYSQGKHGENVSFSEKRWRPDFDPKVEVIGKMALWIRIFGLPVKFFKEFTMAKIGKIIGNVVKVDKLTVGQARGKFDRVCVEVDLNKPLKPFVEVEYVAYNVVYEGISLISFECGCCGHAKYRCPSIVNPVNASTSNASNSDANPKDSEVSASNASDVNMVNMQIEVIKDDMGPWMHMSYKNKKKSNVGSSAKKGGSSGSRFSILQDGKDDENDESVLLANDNPTISKPPIVQAWQSFQEKKKNF